MRTVFILKGLPGCGKSTVAAKMIAKEPGRFIRINRDDLRQMAVGPGNNPHARDLEREEFVRGMKVELLRQAVQDGYDVILDDTHLVPMTVKKLHQACSALGDIKVIEKGINVPIDDCIARDAKREGFAHVGEKIIRDMARGAGLDKGRKLPDKETYYEPRADSFKAIVQDESLPRAIMCDLDGTLALIEGRSPYDATDCDIKDRPNWPVIHTVLAMYAQGVKIIFMSGRDVKYRPETQRFIEKYCRVSNPGSTQDPMETSSTLPIPYELHMRGELDLTKLDQRKDSIIKRELFDAHIAGKYNVLFVLDDRDQVCRLWRQMGLACFQVNYGNF